MDGKKVLVTGGAGFIGSNLVRHLAEDNEVLVLDDLSTGDQDNLEGIQHTFINADIRTLRSIPNDVDFVFHLAAYISVPGSVLEPEKNDAINIIGTQNVLAASKEAGVEKMVFASSAAVYGDVPEDQLPVKEDTDLRPASPYAGSKMTAEDYCGLYCNMFGLRTTSLRMFNVFGPKQDPGSQYAAVIPAFIKRMANDEALIIYGDGEQTRDFVFVEDVARAFVRAAETNDSDGISVNIASGTGASINDLAKELIQESGKDLSVEHQDPRPGDIKHSVASVDLARKVLDWKITTSRVDGLKRTYDWFRS